MALKDYLPPTDHWRFLSGIVLSFTLSVSGFAQPTAGALVSYIGNKEGFDKVSTYDILQDKKGFMWYGCSTGLWRFDGYEHVHFVNDPKDQTSLSDNFVRTIFEDSKGNLWIGTLNGGLNKFNPADNSFTRYTSDEKDSTTLAGNDVGTVVEDKAGNIWVAAIKVHRLNPDGKGFTRIENRDIDDWSALSLHLDGDGIIWVGSAGDGFSRMDLQTGKFKNFKVAHPDPVINTRANVVRKIKDDGKGNLWLATYGGLVKFEKNTGKITHWTHDDMDNRSLPHNSTWDILPGGDKVWVCTWGGGIGYLDLKTMRFENELFKPGGIYGISALEFPTMHCDRFGTLWFGTNARGIFRINPVQGLTLLPRAEGLLNKNIRKIIKGRDLKYFLSDTEGLMAYSEEGGLIFTLPPARDKKPNSLSGNKISDLSEDKDGNLFIGTDFGLSYYAKQTKRISHFFSVVGDTTSLSHNSILCTFIDSENNLWAGTPYGINILYKGQDKFRRIGKKYLSSTNVISFKETDEGIWAGTSTGGLNFIDKRKNKISWYKHDEKNDSSILGDFVQQMLKDSTGLWIVSRSGFDKFDPHSGIFTHTPNLPVGTIKVITLNKNKIYVDNFDSIYEFDPLAEDKPYSLIHFYPASLDAKRFWSPEELRLYLFTEKNVVYIPVDSARVKIIKPPVVITSFLLDPNNKHPMDSSEIRLSPSYRKEITLSYDQNLFSMEFSAMDFSNPGANRYAYKLEGFDEDWTNSGTRRFVTYTNLSHGTYTFRVKGSNDEGLWNEEGASLTIHILPPPWKTWWAYTGYGIIFAGLLLLARRTIVHRERLKAQVAIEQKERQALEAVAQLKTKFFSNITHEFRTPLTLIQGPVNELLEKADTTDQRKMLYLIQSNSSRLLKLINQLLDLAKLDAHEMKLNNQPVNLAAFLKSTVSQFQSMADAKGVTFKWNIPDSLPTVKTDEEKLETIVINLISNAVKFTDAPGSIYVDVSFAGDAFKLTIADTGKGIPAQKLKNVFDRFYQVAPTDASHAEGTGIGLALVKEYVELMKGTIQLESEVGKGTRFDVVLYPEITDESPETKRRMEIHEEVNGNGAAIHADATASVILIVEDNSDIREFIRTCLGSQYRYLEAPNGKEGFRIATHDVPDIIISDLMMPEIDGLELCRLVKKDRRTDHIPFIMLTAKAAAENKLEGLQTGADDYLVKPFNKAELVLKIQNIITLQKNLQGNIRKRILAASTPVEASSAEEQFIARAKAYVESHMTDESLSVESLAGEMNLSREQCYRKLIALTGLSPSAFIRKLKLQKAAQLLAQRSAPVSQIAYETGFENLSHFSKAFKEEFGTAPSEYKQ